MSVESIEMYRFRSLWDRLLVLGVSDVVIRDFAVAAQNLEVARTVALLDDMLVPKLDTTDSGTLLRRLREALAKHEHRPKSYGRFPR